MNRILLALCALLGLAVAVPVALPSSAAGAAVSAAKNPSGFPLYYEDANGVRLDPCLDRLDDHCPLLPNPGVFDPADPIAFPTNFPDEFFYSVVETDRLPTPGCVGAADPIAAGPGTVMVRLALEGAFANGLPAINEQMVFARIRITGKGGLCPNTTYTFTHPYGSIDLTTDDAGSIKPAAGTTDTGCLPTTQTLCDFSLALTSDMLTQGFLRWDPAIAPLADPGYLGGDIATPHEIVGGVNNFFDVTGPDPTGVVAGPVSIASTNLFTVAGRLAGPVVADTEYLDFGGVQLTQSLTKQITLTNVGTDGWFVNAPITSNNPEFTVVNTSCPTAAPGLNRDDTCTVDVQFSPVGAAGPRNFDPDNPVLLFVPHSGLHSPFSIQLQGTGINAGEEPDLSVNPLELAFGSVRVGLLSAPSDVTISNPGVAPLEILNLEFVNTGLSFDSNDKDAFRLTHDGCTGVVVPAGGAASCLLQVSFQPIVAHPYVAALRVTANTSGGPVSVDLQATGIGGVAAVSKNPDGSTMVDPTNGFPVWYQDEAGLRVGQCLDAADPNCIVLPDDFYTGGPVGGLTPDGSDYINFPEEFFWYVAESDPVETPGCGAVGAGSAFIRFAGEGAFVNGPPVPGEQMSFGRIRVSATGLCPNTTYTVVHPYGTIDVQTDSTGKLRRNTSTSDLGCAPVPPATCDFREALTSPVFAGYLHQIGAPAGYLGSPINPAPVTGSLYLADREIAEAGPLGTPTPANYFRIYQKGNPAAFDAETDLFTVMGKLVGPMIATPSSLNFGQIEVGQLSPTQDVVIANDGVTPITINSTTLAGLMPADFTITASTCSVGLVLQPLKINPASNCTLTIQFNPTANGPRSAEATLTHTGVNSPFPVRLDGIGGAAAGFPAISVQPVSVNFPDLHTGETSASESVRVSNVGGTAPLIISSVTTDDTQFVVTDNGCAAPVAPGDECVIRVAFAPSAVGDISGNLVIDHNAPLVADPLPVPLTGRGFGGAPAQSVSQIPAGFPTWFQDNNGVRIDACLTQGDTGCILLGGPGYNAGQPISFPGNFPPEFFWYMAETDPTFSVEDPTCGATGTASLRIAIEGTFGSGQALPGDQLMFDRIRIGVAGLCANTTYHFTHPYGTDQLTTDGAGDGDITFDLTNMIANAPLASRTGLADSGGGGLLRWDPVDAPFAPSGYLGDAVTFHTVVGSTFRPEGVGTEPANYFEIAADDGAGNPGDRLARNDQFAVAGRLAGPIETDVASVAFGNQTQGTLATRTVTVTNLSPANVTVTPSATGTGFSVLGTGTCAADPVLSLDESCTVVVQFDSAGALGARTGTLTIDHTGLHTPSTVALSGTVTQPGHPEISVTPTSVAFGTQNVNTTSAPRTLTITNTGVGPAPASDLHINALQWSGVNATMFAANHNCPAAIPVGGTCQVTVTFTPTSTGNKSATLAVNSTAVQQPSVLISLSGSGIAAQVQASPTSLSFATKGTSTKSITLTNTGTAPFSLIGNPAFSWAGQSARFSAANNGCNNVAPGGKCTVNVTFNGGGGGSGTFNATLFIQSNAINSPTAIALTGQQK